METTSLSIIIPVYNTGDRLRRCLDSVLNQSFTAWELILVDDGSEAPTAEICDSYAGQDTRIKVLHTVNGGVSAARNRGLTFARNPWICFIDSDDWVEADYLKTYADRIGTGADLVLGGYVKTRGETEIGRRHLTDGFVPKDDIPGYFLENNLLDFGSPCCKLFRRDTILREGLRFPEAYSYGEDTLFFFKYLQYCQSITCVGREDYHYVENTAESLSQRVHHSLPLLRFIKDNTEVMGAFPFTPVWEEILCRQNAKNIALANRAYINMFKLNYPKEQGLDVIRFFRQEVRPLLYAKGVSAHDRGFLALTALPDRLQWAVMTTFRKTGIIHV
jgi:Glycosyltransferases involved in cell wall biogenesis